MEASLYPVFLDLSGMSVLIVGGGPVACRKAAGLIRAGARVIIVSPSADPRIIAWEAEGKAVWIRREYLPGEAAGYPLVFAATNSPEVNARVSEDAKAAGRFVNVTDGQPIGNAVVPSVVRRGHLAIAVTTSGVSPAAARLLRQQLEKQFGPEYEDLMVRLKTVRQRLLLEGADTERIRAVFTKMLDPSFLALLRQRRFAEADRIVRRWLEGQEEHE